MLEIMLIVDSMMLEGRYNLLDLGPANIGASDAFLAATFALQGNNQKEAT